MKIIFTQKSPLARDCSPIIFSPKQHDEVRCSVQGQKHLVIGIEDPQKVDHRKLFQLARKIIVQSRAHRMKKIILRLEDLSFPHLSLSDEQRAETFMTNMEMANYEFIRYKTPPKDGWIFVEEVYLVGKVTPKLKASWEKGRLIGTYVNQSREISNTPGSDMTPKKLADQARRSIKGTNANISVLDATKMKALKMEGVLSVAKGSTEDPQFIIIDYRGGKPKEKPIVLVGKGVTFDTGGINLKPTDALKDMQMDMSGGAAVIFAIALAARLKLKKNIVALIPAVENMPSGSSYRPGDVVRTMSGKTVEIDNTDAEGRVTLTDALTYAKRYDPALVISVATLTGAAMVALGYRCSALFTKDDTFRKVFAELGEQTGDYVWPLPLWEEYEAEIKGTMADLTNTGKHRWGGAITGAAFLYQFAKDYPWVYLDIAPRTTAADDEYLAKGSAGAPVRLLLKALETL